MNPTKRQTGRNPTIAKVPRGVLAEYLSIAKEVPELWSLLDDVLEIQPTHGEFAYFVKPLIQQIVFLNPLKLSLPRGDIYGTAHEVLSALSDRTVYRGFELTYDDFSVALVRDTTGRKV